MTPQPEPYSLQASCELSQDYFLTSDLIIGTSDQVIPFVNPYTKLTEAVVFSAGSGSVYHLQRDPSSTTGWAPVTIDLSGNVTEPTDVAVAGNSSATYMLVLGSPADPSGGPAWVTRLDSATSWDEGFIATYDDLGFGQLDITAPTLGQFKGGIDQNYTCYFYASATDASTQTTSIVGWVPQESGGEFSLGFQLLQSIDSSELTISDYIVLFNTSNSQAPAGYSLILTGAGSLNVYAQQHTPDQVTPVFGANPIDDAGGANVTALLWAWATLGSKSGVPGYAYQTATATWFVPEDKSPAQSLTDKPSASPNSVAVWTGDP